MARKRRRHLSQVRAADQIGIDYRHYQNIEGGKINIRLDTFLKLVDFYDLPKSLLDYELPPPPLGTGVIVVPPEEKQTGVNA